MAPNENLGSHLESGYYTYIYKSPQILHKIHLKMKTPKYTKLRPSGFDLVNNSILGKMT